jgi:hypothetical protein
MHKHSVKTGLVAGDDKVNNRGDSPLKKTIDKIRSISGLEEGE